MLLRPVELTTAFFQKSLSIDPNLAYTHVQLGRLLLHWEWDWSGAKNEFERAIELDPNDLRARAQLAWVTEGMLGNNDRNIFYLRQIVASDPLDEEYLNYLAEVLEYAGQWDSAAATWQRLSDLHPGRYHAAYAEFMLLDGGHREALEELQKEVDEIQMQAGLALVYWK